MRNIERLATFMSKVPHLKQLIAHTKTQQGRFCLPSVPQSPLCALRNGGTLREVSPQLQGGINAEAMNLMAIVAEKYSQLPTNCSNRDDCVVEPNVRL